MSNIHYFQRYATKENTVTNNTLLLLGRIYSYSNVQVSRLLTELTGESVEIGVEIKQQEGGRESIPDGTLIQRSIKIIIEAKVDSPPDDEQLLRHADRFSDESQKILFLLTRKPIEKDESDTIKRDIKRKDAGILFKNITYGDICTAVRALFKEHEHEMCDLVDDYEAYCSDMDLIDQSSFLMRIVPCGKSMDINKTHGIYFHSSDRSYRKHRYVGLYKAKAVQAILEIDSIFDVTYDKKKSRLNKEFVDGRKTSDYDDELISIIEAAKKECGYNIEKGRRFFCGKSAVETAYNKSSPGGIFGHRYVDLQKLGVIDGDGKSATLSDIAQRLKDIEWE